ncbi:hypothetical protein A2Z00_02085 [Candidatus Gottesmanbacteria bacterium RBG_13_45_10]|uniref:Uncharacterized protein n=1 Tax=Candidatus Gottesmanbacteria bacterium RBG_13_45_10 TaxID=1798370 RepID=A0A1F5ZIP1_9BACT|nr:MAG: hypothetical protein A2Z00_02085 [Candidatus Gottesmanbacteria bacterium RBG_13_45_10]
MHESEQSCIRIINGHVCPDPDNKKSWELYDQDTFEARMSDSGCPGGGYDVGPAQLEYNRLARYSASKELEYQIPERQPG